jgi:D-3-phosphoglycerate dehydrogenase / 2-oxoglutarate reductase
MSKQLVIQTEDLEPGPAAWLGERVELVRCAASDAAFPSLLVRAAGLVVRTYTRVDASMLDAGPHLEVVARAGVALENIDLDACKARGVAVVHTPGANTRAVVEYLTSLVLDALRARITITEPLLGDDWHATRKQYFQNQQVGDLTLGLLGFGRIGTAMARVGAALDMRVLYHDLIEIAEDCRHGAQPVSLDELLGEADILSVHIDSRPSNRHFLAAAQLSKMKPTVLLVNTSRGFVIEPSDLANHLRSHPEARALLDVHDPFEPIPADYPLWDVPGATLFPHLAAGTTTAKTNMSWVVKDVWRVLNGEEPQWPAQPFASGKAQGTRH